MGDERKEQAQRIRAARDWLDEAGDSLEQGADINGDLKVMLAQAELARAKETKRPAAWRYWGRRVLPLATAASLLALGLFLQPASAPPADGPMPQGPAAQVETAARPAALADGEEDAAREALAAASAAASAGAPEEEQRIASASPPEAPPAQAPAVRGQTVPQAPAAARETAPRVPSPETQKLMQSAGKALRAP